MRIMFGRLSTKGITSYKLSETHGLTSVAYRIRETHGVIITDYSRAIDAALLSIREERENLIDYLDSYPFFEYSLESMGVIDYPRVVHLMSRVSDAVGVGPMAAIAGVLADLAAERMIEHGAKVAVVENGGEASLYSDRPLVVSVGAGECCLSNRIGFNVVDFPCGVATSSGRYSHAFSEGDADSVTVFGVNAGLADAVATMAANKVMGEAGLDVMAGVKSALSFEGVYGVLVIRDQRVSIGGRLPQIVSIETSQRDTHTWVS